MVIYQFSTLLSHQQQLKHKAPPTPCSQNTGTLGCLPLRTSSWSALTFQSIILNNGEIAAEYFMRVSTVLMCVSEATAPSEASGTRFTARTSLRLPAERFRAAQEREAGLYSRQRRLRF